MPLTPQLSQDQRAVLARLLQARQLDLQHGRAAQLQGQSQVESARQTLLQDADDASQQSGAHEVAGTIANIDSGEFNAVSSALQRIHRAGYGLCTDCQAAIPFDRLRLAPQTLRCAACQTIHERKPTP